MAPKVSVIVPVYKVEEYLPRCLRSLEEQTMFDDLEIFLVDDGTPDRSGEMCDAFAEKHPNVRVIHKENGGQGSARNAALDLATGEYIAFLDSDDYVVRNAYERAYEAAVESGADIVSFRLTITRDDHGVAPEPKGEPRIIRGAAEIFGVFAARRYKSSEVVWDKIYRRALFDGLRFPPRMKCEDTFILPSLLPRAETMLMLPDCLIIYRLRSTSTMRTRGDRLVEDRVKAHEEVNRVAREQFPAYLNDAKARTYFVRISCLNNILDCPRFRKHPSWKIQIREFRQQLPDLLRTKHRRYLPFYRKLYAIVLAYFTEVALVYERIRFRKKRRELSYVDFPRN